MQRQNYLVRCCKLNINNKIVRKFSLNATASLPTQSWGVFPREKEGNLYAVNWSLNVDGVTPVGAAYRNARIGLLTSRLSSKVDSKGKVELAKPVYSGLYTVKEAGDTVSQDAFDSMLTERQQYLSSGVDLFVEDASLGAYSPSRIGARIISDKPALSLIARALMIPSPSRPTDHRARFNGWNKEPRWLQPEITWNGSTYDVVDIPTVDKKGERPIVAFVGGAGSDIAVQFVQSNKKIVGANVIAGESAPVRGLIAAVGEAACVLINAQSATSIAVPSIALTKGNDTIVVINGDDSLATSAAQKKTLYGAYHNVLSTNGVSALWNGYIGATSTNGSLPTVVVGGQAAVALEPNNLAFPSKEIYFFEEGATKGKLTEEEAIKKLVDITDESKKEVAGSILKGANIYVTGSTSDILESLLDWENK